MSRLRSIVHGARWWAWTIAHNANGRAEERSNSASNGGDPTDSPWHEAIVRYYDLTHHHYHLVWSDWQTQALHYGIDDEQTRNHTQRLQRTNEVLAAALELKPGMRVLDAGCGTGGSACWLAEQFGVHVTGLTISPRQAKLARENADRRGLADSVRFVCGNYDRLDASEGSFDRVWALESFVHGPDKRATLTEMARVLKPGGRLVIADGMRGDERHRLDTWLLERIERGWTLPGIAAVQDYRRWLAETGFEDIAVVDHSAAIGRSARRLALTCAAVLPGMTIGHRIGLIHDVERANVLGTIAAWAALRRGAWTYHVVTARRAIS